MICQQAEDESADRAHGQRDRDRQGDSGNRAPKILTYRRQNKHEHEKVKRVQRPTEKSGQHGVAGIRSCLDGQGGSPSQGVPPALAPRFAGPDAGSSTNVSSVTDSTFERE